MDSESELALRLESDGSVHSEDLLFPADIAAASDSKSGIRAEGDRSAAALSASLRLDAVFSALAKGAQRHL